LTLFRVVVGYLLGDVYGDCFSSPVRYISCKRKTDFSGRSGGSSSERKRGERREGERGEGKGERERGERRERERGERERGERGEGVGTVLVDNCTWTGNHSMLTTNVNDLSSHLTTVRYFLVRETGDGRRERRQKILYMNAPTLLLLQNVLSCNTILLPQTATICILHVLKPRGEDLDSALPARHTCTP
jgi:hypothetical protein